jgi:hypothetical protein
MRLQQYMITELFDTKVPIKLKERDKNPFGETYYYEFLIDDYKYTFIGEFFKYPDKEEYKESSVLTVEFHQAGFYEITDAGDAFKVFSAVKSCLMDLLKKLPEKPDSISFSGTDSEPSRIKLYDRFAKVIPRILKGYKFIGKEHELDGKSYKFRSKKRR